MSVPGSVAARHPREYPDIFVAKNGSVGIVLARFLQREQPLDEVVMILHLLVAVGPDLLQASAPGVAAGSLVELDELRHRLPPFAGEDGQSSVTLTVR